MSHPLSVRLIGDESAGAELLDRLAAAGIRRAQSSEPADAGLILAGGRGAVDAIASVAAVSDVPVVVVGIERDAELTRSVWRAGADEVVFVDELDQLPKLLAELCERGRRVPPPEFGEDETLQALILALDTREQETAGHSHRVALWTLFLAVVASVEAPKLRAIHRGSLLHDLGKIGIPDSILLKSGELTPQEWDVMRTHPQIGRDLVRRIARLRAAAEIPWAHHERWDGSGYPRGLKGKEIPLGARLFAIVDVYDALRSDRSYKRACGHREAVAFLREASGKHFDPELCAEFVALPEQTWDDLAAPDLMSCSFPQLLMRVHAVLARLGTPVAASR